MEHEEWGERTQAMLLIVGAFEIVGLLIRRSPNVKLVHGAAALAGSDPEVRMFEVESMLRDGKNPRAALDQLARINLPDGNRFMASQHASLQADRSESTQPRP